MSFSENLQAIRKKNRLSQEELAELLGVSRQAVSKWELGIGYSLSRLIFSKMRTFSKVLIFDFQGFDTLSTP